MRHTKADGTVDETFAKMMFALAQALGAELTVHRIKLYARLLDDIELPDLQRAFAMTAATAKAGFLPSPGDIRKHVRPAAEDAALVAWTSLQNAAAHVGAWADLRVDDACAAEALLLVFGSWADFCRLEDGPALTLKRQEFMAAYRAAHVTRRALGPKVLRGLCSATGSAPDAALRGHTWSANLLPDGALVFQRSTPALEGGDGKEGAAALPEAAATRAETAEAVAPVAQGGGSQAGRKPRRQGRPAAGDGARP